MFVSIIHSLYDSVVDRIRILYLRIMGIIVVKDKKMISFIPHGGMFDNGYDLFNYKSDNALCLLHYMIKTYGNKYKYRLACDKRQYDNLHKRIKLEFSDIDIDCFPYFQGKLSHVVRHNDLLRSKIIFMSEGYPLYFKTKSVKVYFLNYFVPFKNDYGKRSLFLQKFETLFDGSFSTSRINSYIVSTDYDMSFSKFQIMGFPRNDELLQSYSCRKLDDDIKKACNYTVKTVILYTPTHRDYERNSDKKRSLLGFKVDERRLSEFLKNNQCLLICKLHSAQNVSVIDGKLPDGILLYQSNCYYGLCELMQRADCLITDYTSAYFDFILLDRPVLFNFYDYKLYEETRGFTYDPLEPLLAGDIFCDEESFFEKLHNTINSADIYAEKRGFVRKMMHKYTDTNSSERICHFVLRS